MPIDPNCVEEETSQTQSNDGRRGPRFWRSWANSHRPVRLSKARALLQEIQKPSKLCGTRVDVPHNHGIL